MNIERLKRFVLERETRGGGFSFCYPLPASTPETFYAIYILKSIGKDIPNLEEHRRFVVSKLREAKSVSPIYLLLKCHEILDIGIENRGNLEKYLMKKFDSISHGGRGLSRELGTTATYSFEMPTFLENLTYIVKSLIIIQSRKNSKYFIKRDAILSSVRDLRSAYFAVSLLEKGADRLREFILQHQLPGGGFSKTPGSSPPYLEDTFYALSSLHRLETEPEETHYRFLKKLQSRGGFRRSIYGGIPTFEDSYYAVASLKILGKI